MNSPSNNQPRPAAVEQGALPVLPEWAYRDDLGGLVLSEIRTALNEHARAAWNMGLDAGLLHAPAVTDTGLPELRDHLATAKVMDRSITLSPAAAGALYRAMTMPAQQSTARQSDALVDWAAYIDGPELQELKAEALALAAGGANMSMDVGCMFVLAMIERIESRAAAPKVAGYIEPQEIPCIGQCRTTLWATKQSSNALAVYLVAPANEARIVELEAQLAKHNHAHWILSQTLHNIMVGNQAAYIEWQEGSGATMAMEWIFNGLVGPGLVPESNGKTAQQWFDANSDYRMEPTDPHPSGKEL